MQSPKSTFRPKAAKLFVGGLSCRLDLRAVNSHPACLAMATDPIPPPAQPDIPIIKSQATSGLDTVKKITFL